MQSTATLRCVLDALSLFGENTKVALLSQLGKDGVSFTPEKFDIEKFCTSVTTLLDQWSDLLFVKIIEDVCRQSDTSLEDLGLRKGRYLHSSELLKELFVKIEAR